MRINRNRGFQSTKKGSNRAGGQVWKAVNFLLFLTCESRWEASPNTAVPADPSSCWRCRRPAKLKPQTSCVVRGAYYGSRFKAPQHEGDLVEPITEHPGVKVIGFVAITCFNGVTLLTLPTTTCYTFRVLQRTHKLK